MFVCATRSRLIEVGRILSRASRFAVERVLRRGLELRDGLLAVGRVERTDDGPLERTVGPHVQIGVTLGLTVGELLRLDHHDRVVRDRPRVRP